MSDPEDSPFWRYLKIIGLVVFGLAILVAGACFALLKVLNGPH